jgi:hypothetical protein
MIGENDRGRDRDGATAEPLTGRYRVPTAQVSKRAISGKTVADRHGAVV